MLTIERIKMEQAWREFEPIFVEMKHNLVIKSTHTLKTHWINWCQESENELIYVVRKCFEFQSVRRVFMSTSCARFAKNGQ